MHKDKYSPITVDGIEYKTLSDAVNNFNVKLFIVERKLELGWSVAESFGLVDRIQRCLVKPKVSLKPITIDGVDFESISAAARHYGLKLATLHDRLKRGETPEKAVLTRVSKSKKPITIDGVDFESVSAAARHYGLKPEILYDRLRRGSTPEKAILMKDKRG